MSDGNADEVLSRLVGHRLIYEPDGSIENPHLDEMVKSYSEQLGIFCEAAPGLESADFCLLHDFRLNALTNRRGGRGVIGITVGAPLLLHEFFSALMAHPRFLEDIGESREEVIRFDELRLPESADTLTHPGDARFVSAPRIVARNPARREVAKVLVKIALDFLYLHEAGHLIAGHVPYLRRRLNLQDELSAFGDSPASFEAGLLYHTVEFDADWFAMKLLVPLCERDSLITASFENLGSDPDLRFRIVATAIISAILIGDSGELPFEHYFQRQHPHPYWRAIMLETAALQSVRENCPHLEQVWETAHRRCLKELHLVSGFVPLFRSYFQGITEIGPLINQRMDRVYSRHGEMVDELKALGVDFRQLES